MNPKDLFLAALEKPPGEREQFLASLEPGLRRRVEELLAAHAEPGLNRGAAVLEPTLQNDVQGSLDFTVDVVEPGQAGEMQFGEQFSVVLQPGLRIGGRYVLKERLGEGGMGEVWLAEQVSPIRREVALKLMRPGTESRAFIARFEAERQALALMDHPNIARVFDAGVTRDLRPFFVMELVRGRPLVEFCDERMLTPRERLELFVSICQAVQHAHQKGIIHRDLKPSNILVTLVDGRPVPKVIDFGVAKARGSQITDASLATDAGVIVGTLEYMSPEQAGLGGQDVDTRADVYSLGVVLYELLTGLRPIDSERLRRAAFAEMIRIIQEEEPSKPSTRLSTAEALPSLAAVRQTEPKKLVSVRRGELDWIVMKCLEKDRNRRYETANNLARDVQRYLADEAVEARPPSFRYRAGKFIKRNRAVVLAASAVLLALVAGMVGTGWGLIRAERARAAAAERAEGERQAKLEAEKRLKQVRASIDILMGVFQDLNINQMKQTQEPLEAALAQRLIGAARQLEGESVGDPLLVAQVQNQLGMTLAGLGFATEAGQLLSKAGDTRKKSLGADHWETLFTMSNLAEALRLQGQIAPAVKLLEDTVQRLSVVLGETHPVTLKAMSSLATAYSAAGQNERSLPLHEKVLAAQRAKPEDDPLGLLISMSNLAEAYRHAGKYDLALPLYAEAVRLQEARLGADHPTTLLTLHNLGGAHLEAGRRDTALPLIEKAFLVRKARLGADHPDTLASMSNLAEAHSTGGNLTAALPMFEQLFDLMRKKHGPDHPHTLTVMSNLASACKQSGQLGRAVALWEENLQRVQAKLGQDHPDAMVIMANLGTAYQHAGQMQKGLPLLQQALELKKAKLGPDHPGTLAGMNGLGEALLFATRYAEALSLFQEALRLRREKLGADHPDTLISMNNLGLCHRELGRNDLALPLFEEALQGMKVKLGSDHFNTLTCMNNLALAHLGMGRLDLALPLFEQSLEIRERKLGPNHPDTLQSLGNLAAGLWVAKQPDRSRALFEETLKRYKTSLGNNHPNTLRIQANYAIILKETGRPAEAVPLLEEVHRAAAQQPMLRFAGMPLFDAIVKAGQKEPAARLAAELVALDRASRPKDSPELGNTLSVLGTGLVQLGAFAEAEPHLRESLAIREKTQPELWQTFGTRSLLGEALLGQKKYAEAEPLLLAGYQGLKEREKAIPAEARSLRLREAVQRLLNLYTATNDADKAAMWKKELESISPPPSAEAKP